MIRCGAAQKTFLVVMMVLGPVEIVPRGVHARPHYVGDDRLVLRVGDLAAISVDVDSIRFDLCCAT